MYICSSLYNFSHPKTISNIFHNSSAISLYIICTSFLRFRQRRAANWYIEKSTLIHLMVSFCDKHGVFKVLIKFISFLCIVHIVACIESSYLSRQKQFIKILLKPHTEIIQYCLCNRNNSQQRFWSETFVRLFVDNGGFPCGAERLVVASLKAKQHKKGNPAFLIYLRHLNTQNENITLVTKKNNNAYVFNY